jgi:very-short-patch-repair endonuclease
MTLWRPLPQMALGWWRNGIDVFQTQSMPVLRTSPALGRLAKLAGKQGGVVSRIQAYELGVTRAQIRAYVRARRWRRVGSQSIAPRTGALTTAGQFWAATFEAGPRAQLDGVSSLIASGLTGFHSDRIRVSVPRGARVRRAKGLDIRQTRRWDAADLVPAGVPRTSPPVAGIRAALWARSDRQAALVLTMTVQQGLATAEALGREALRIRRDRRRRLLHEVILDLAGGVRSLGELDFARECRRRGLPEPSRQVVRKGPNGRYYLDVAWKEWGVVIEIDGIQHSWAMHVVDDALRQNDVTLQDAVVLRLPLLGFRVAKDAFFSQVEEALMSRGCPLLGRSA